MLIRMGPVRQRTLVKRAVAKHEVKWSSATTELTWRGRPNGRTLAPTRAEDSENCPINFLEEPEADGAYVGDVEVVRKGRHTTAGERKRARKLEAAARWRS